MEHSTQICPWCDTEIVWDEELGPEEFCPHCGNELKGYRTISIGLNAGDTDGGGEDQEEDEEDLLADVWKPEQAEQNWELDAYDEEEEEAGHGQAKLAALKGFNAANTSLIAFDHAVERMLDEQEEVPECPSCREYMLETGRQTVEAGYVATVHKPSSEELLPAPLHIVWYVCPACFHVLNRLAAHDRDRFVGRLSKLADEEY